MSDLSTEQLRELVREGFETTWEKATAQFAGMPMSDVFLEAIKPAFYASFCSGVCTGASVFAVKAPKLVLELVSVLASEGAAVAPEGRS